MEINLAAIIASNNIDCDRILTISVFFEYVVIYGIRYSQS